MQENEFEKQVQQKMDDLKLHPSDAVWQKIELQIKKEKRRRWLLIFLPVIFMGALYGGYVLLNSNNSTTKPQQQLTNSVHEKNTTDQQTQETKTTFDPIKNDEQVKENKEIITQTTNTTSNSRQKVKGRLKVTTDHNTPVISANDSSDAKTTLETTQGIAETGKINADIKNPEQEKTIINKENQSNTVITNPNEIAKHAKDDMVKDSVATKSENTVAKENAIPNEIKKTQNKYPWNWGFSFAAGASGTANSILGELFGDGQKSMDLAYNSPGSGTNTNPLPLPSLIKPGIAFIAGVSAEKNISRKIIFTTGLNYKLFNTSNKVGSDSASYYSARNASRTYHNHYNYIELPVGLKYQMGIFKKIQLQWNTGFSISRLISSDALQFNNTTRLYYHDNSLFNQTQLGFNTGVDIELLSNQNRSFFIGPYLNYGISKIAREGYNKHHFTFIGLRAQYLFRKN